MTRLLHKFLLLLYGGVALFVISVFLIAFQSAPQGRHCQDNSREMCLFEENIRNFLNSPAKEDANDDVMLLALSRKFQISAKNSEDINQDEAESLWNQAHKVDYEMPAKDSFSFPADLDQTKINRTKIDQTKINRTKIDQTKISRPKIDQTKIKQKEVETAAHYLSKVSPQQTGLNPDPSSLRPFPPIYRTVLPNGLNCSKVWQGDLAEIRRAEMQLNDTQPARRLPGFYKSVVDNCAQYRQQNGYILNVSAEERKFPLAFSVMVYKDPEQFERLMRAVYRPSNVYCVHLDLKTKPDVAQNILAIIQCLPNVVEAPRRVSVVWGKFSVLEPELICMDLLWRLPSKWRYFINLTGQEFPLKTNKELVRILQQYRGANDIMGESPKSRNKWRWAMAGPPPHNVSISKGPVHVAASRGFVNFLLHSKHAQDFLAWTKRTAIPDETFFATINNLHRLGVPGSYTGNLTSRRRIMINRFKIWDVTNRSCSGQYVRHICHFGLKEVSILTNLKHLVANKFTYNNYPLAYDCLEQWYFDRVGKEDKSNVVRVDTRYYSNLEIVKYALRNQTGPWG